MPSRAGSSSPAHNPHAGVPAKVVTRRSPQKDMKVSKELRQEVEELGERLCSKDADLKEEQERRSEAEREIESLKVQLSAATESLYSARESPRRSHQIPTPQADTAPAEVEASPGVLAAQAVTWGRFVRTCRTFALGERDLVSLSEGTFRELTTQLGFGRDAVERAHLEVEWRKRVEAMEAASSLPASSVQRSPSRGLPHYTTRPASRSASPQRLPQQPPSVARRSSSVSHTLTATERQTVRSLTPGADPEAFVVTMPPSRPSFSARKALGNTEPASGMAPPAGDAFPRRAGRCSPMRRPRSPELAVPLPPYGGAAAPSPAPVVRNEPRAAGQPSCSALRAHRRSASPLPTGSYWTQSADPNAVAAPGRGPARACQRRSRSQEHTRIFGTRAFDADKQLKSMVCGPDAAEYKPRRHNVAGQRRMFAYEGPATVASLGERGYTKSLEYSPYATEHRPRRTQYAAGVRQFGVTSQVAACLSPDRTN
eukprot:Hpha_TRINITY_DN1854_c0_g1::TRINITY_DN1854_c0_g1_i1::g.170569::m.170569